MAHTETRREGGHVELCGRTSGLMEKNTEEYILLLTPPPPDGEWCVSFSCHSPSSPVLSLSHKRHKAVGSREAQYQNRDVWGCDRISGITPE